jgi:two-component system CheB/CheR fusion protein
LQQLAQQEACVTSPDRFPVVGIGSSAGGVEALQAMFENMPREPGMAFILVSHLARDHPSALSEIVARDASMLVQTAEDGTEVRVNTIYVCPPNQILTVASGKLHLTALEGDQQRNIIDLFLSSLGEAAVGVLLSGSGNDGTLGIKAIKERGGLAVAQGADGSVPLHSEMPNAAIATGVVDIVATVDEIPSRLADYARSFRILEGKIADEDEQPSGKGLVEQYEPIYRLLRNRIGHDFSGYKEKTFTRRVRRRMQVLRLTRLPDYVDRLKNDPEEVTLLFRDLLISVTSFFRNPEAFDALEQLVIPRLLEGKGANDTVRIWCPGCATGEEVYSIAILMREHMDPMRSPPKVQIFATDIDEPALEVARAGRYPEPLLENVSPERLKRFFVADQAAYTIQKEIRDMCIFSSHSVIRDPPFSRIDLISCRNLLIYLGSEFQNQVIPVFHFALRSRGFLFLGTSENVTQHSDLFSPVDRSQRIFQRRDHAVAPLRFPMFMPASRELPPARELRQHSTTAAANLRRYVESRVMERFAPPHVVVNAEGDILHFSPRTGKYLEPATGLPSRQLLAMARRGLRLDLRAALREAVETRTTATRENVEVEVDAHQQLIDITVEPFGSEHEPLFLVLFQDVGASFPRSAELRPTVDGPEHYERLEQELRETRERLQSTVEEYETGVEELKASNEELQSINEELQSTNEELETSKEELQSVNEELHTVNAELNVKVEEVDRAHSDLRNVFEGIEIATVFLDRDLRIRSFTPAVSSIFNLISNDRGRPLSDISSNLEDEGDLRREVQAVLERGEPIERNVRRSDGRAQYLMRILPYRGHNKLVQGVLVTFVEVTQILAAEAQQRTLVEELNHRVRNMLTVVNAIARQTLGQTRSPQQFADAFTGRIEAMGAAYGLVSRENWGNVALREVIQEQLRPYELDAADRVRIEGPEVSLEPNAALALGLVIHELATNAVKHGALSVPDGRVAIRWEADSQPPPRLRLHWTESGGPPARRPSRRGFGTNLIERELSHTLDGTASFEFTAEGFSATISFPFDPKRMSRTGSR